MFPLARLRTITVFAEQGVVAEAPPAGVTRGGWQKNGQTSVQIASFLPQRMTIRIEAVEPALVGTSIMVGCPFLVSRTRPRA